MRSLIFRKFLSCIYGWNRRIVTWFALLPFVWSTAWLLKLSMFESLKDTPTASVSYMVKIFWEAQGVGTGDTLTQRTNDRRDFFLMASWIELIGTRKYQAIGA
jgi:hypothetical protein